MARIFLCHAREDKAQVRDVYRQLKDLGFEPWLDEEDLLPGQIWEREIPLALKASDFILIFLSCISVAKRSYFQREMKLALAAWQEMPEGTIHTIPVRLDDCEIPKSFQRYQWVNLFDPNGFNRMVGAIRTELANQQIGQPQPPAMPPPSSGVTQSPVPNQTEADIKTSPTTVRIYALGPPNTSISGLSWTPEYARAKERWDAFWKSHSAGLDGIPTNSAEYLSRYHAIRSDGYSDSPSSKTTSHTRPPGSLPSVFERLQSDHIRKIGDVRPNVFTRNIKEFDEQGVGFMVIHKDQLSDYCRPLPSVRKF